MTKVSALLRILALGSFAYGTVLVVTGHAQDGISLKVNAVMLLMIALDFEASSGRRG